jgi:hypothetical protein
VDDSQNLNQTPKENMNAPQGDNDKSPNHIQIDGTAGGVGPANGGPRAPEAPETSSHRPITSEFPEDFFPPQLEKCRHRHVADGSAQAGLGGAGVCVRGGRR